MKRWAFIFILISLSNILVAQTPLWKFYLAFEDAVGAKDTVWFVQDTTSTTGMDAQFGEAPMSLPIDTFQVYVKFIGDSMKTMSLPTTTNNWLKVIYGRMEAYPVKMSWDTSLLYFNNLPFDITVAKITNNYYTGPGLNLLMQDTVTLTEDIINIPHFPIDLEINGIFIGTVDLTNELQLKLHPNPTTGKFQIQSPKSQRVQVFDLLGNIVLRTEERQVDLSGHPSGIYFVKAGEQVLKLVLSK